MNVFSSMTQLYYLRRIWSLSNKKCHR